MKFGQVRQLEVGLAKIGRKPCGETTGQMERALGKGSW